MDQAIDYTHCPKCGWDCESTDGDPDAPVEIQDVRDDFEFGYLGGQHWTEIWTCPVCETKFEIKNSSV
jgi:hypothetical protein